MFENCFTQNKRNDEKKEMSNEIFFDCKNKKQSIKPLNVNH